MPCNLFAGHHYRVYSAPTADKQSASDAAKSAALAIRQRLAAQGKIPSGPPPGQPPPGTVPGAPLLPAPGLPATAATPAPAQLTFKHEIEINDSPQRASLTRGGTQDRLSSQFSVSVTTKGRYYAPHEKANLSSSTERPLYLLIEAPDQEKLDAAKAAIEKIKEMGGQTPTYERRKITAKVWVNIEIQQGSPFDLVAKLTGPENSYLKHIATESGCKVELRGRGSGTFERASGRESHENLHIFLEHVDRHSVNTARGLCENLVKVVSVPAPPFRSR